MMYGGAQGPVLAKTIGDAPKRVGRKTVLVADDDADARSALCNLLASEGYDVIEAADGAKALELLAAAADDRAPAPDIVLLDIVMPRFSGLGILRVMRRFDRPPPTIVMTALADPSIDVFARNFGAIRVLRKPLNVTEMLAAVRDASLGPVQPGKARGR